MYTDRSLSEPDQIQLNDLQLLVPLNLPSPWTARQGTFQPVSATVTLFHNLSRSGASDDLGESLDYSVVSKRILGRFHPREERVFPSLASVVDEIADCVFTFSSRIERVVVKLSHAKALLLAKSASCMIERTRRTTPSSSYVLSLTDIHLLVIIGVNSEEKIEPQSILLSVSLAGFEGQPSLDLRGLEKALHTTLANSKFQTLEAFATAAARTALATTYSSSGSLSHVTLRATITVRKPRAIVLADSAAVTISRVLADFPEIIRNHSNSSGATRREISPHTVVIAFGSNLGDSFANIERALRLLERPSQLNVEEQHRGAMPANPTVFVVDTSFLYESAPMYVTDQPRFKNGACLIETNIPPRPLLALLKAIELAVGRQTSYRNGPRAVDLDIVFFDSEDIDTRPSTADRSLDESLQGHLVVPHPKFKERDFVLGPLNDMIPDYVDPSSGKTIRQLWTALLAGTAEMTMHRVIPFPRYPSERFNSAKDDYCPEYITHWSMPISPLPPLKSGKGKKLQQFPTYIMATLNTTPDSFSDGADNDTIPAALAYVRQSVAWGAHIVDVGGYSTRPGAAFVGAEEEIERVVPVIRAIRSSAEAKEKTVLISVDTFRVEVARAAIEAGANCINDVSAFAGSADWPCGGSQEAAEKEKAHFPAMKTLARETGVPVVLMHSRGEAGQNKDYSAYAHTSRYGDGEEEAVIAGVRAELGERVGRAVIGRGGLRRWQVIVDPGIGFSKSVEANLALVKLGRGLTSISSFGGNLLEGFPVLIGTSRKSYLGTILKEGHDGDDFYEGRETTPKERGWATATAVASAVLSGAEVVRVHDVLEMGDVVRVAKRMRSSQTRRPIKLITPRL